MRKSSITMSSVALLMSVTPALAGGEGEPKLDYEVVATSRTSTFVKELNKMAERGYRLVSFMGGETSFGGDELVASMSRPADVDPKWRYDYTILATSRTSKMEDELRELGASGYEYRGVTVAGTLVGHEVVIVLEREHGEQSSTWDYRVLATKRTSTMSKELNRAGQQGWVAVGLALGATAFADKEIVSILRRRIEQAPVESGARE